LKTWVCLSCNNSSGIIQRTMEKRDNLKILYFGIYSKGIEYPRNNNLIRALSLNGAEVMEAHTELAVSFEERVSIVKKPVQGIWFFLGLLSSFIALSYKFIKTHHVDVVIVGHPGYFHVHPARLLCHFFHRKAILVYDVFIPLYEALVEDRRLINQESIPGKLLYRFERSCCQCADLCLTDTEAHRNYLINAYGLPSGKVSRAFVGSTINIATGDSLYKPMDNEVLPPPFRERTVGSPEDNKLPSNKSAKDLSKQASDNRKPLQGTVLNQEIFNVLFVGTYIPLHGIDIILEAARQLQHDPCIKFTLAGSGQLRQEMENLAHEWTLENVVFYDWIPTGSLGSFIRYFDLALGIFGTTSKAARVIPSKIYDLCAVGIPFITSDTPAIKEVFSHGKNSYLIPPGDAKALADAIVYLKGNYDVRMRISEGARQAGENIFSFLNIGKDLLGGIVSGCKSRS
jgi:glycosyltransferase involved in cell wall biosynthesis